MSKNINCAQMGYECVFSITADDDEEQLILDTTEKHAAKKHTELMDDQVLKPDVKEKLRKLLAQSHYEAE